MAVIDCVCSSGQCPGGEGLQGGDEVDSREQYHPSGEAQLHRGWDVQSSVRGHPHPHAKTGGKMVQTLECICWKMKMYG